ncbi:hypothetical protein CTRI78_v008901 [Colletotrichum trifolii]|uniref:Uncharacterized protein n=1 Tax=Colletotrichum trifolii TaxID=5466 RepID=A0A4R8QXN5_COLTR|nr:hypothetical protein CTRI78_v008901 [Colletotrichum trifolii]
MDRRERRHYSLPVELLITAASLTLLVCTGMIPVLPSQFSHISHAAYIIPPLLFLPACLMWVLLEAWQGWTAFLVSIRSYIVNIALLMWALVMIPFVMAVMVGVLPFAAAFAIIAMVVVGTWRKLTGRRQLFSERPQWRDDVDLVREREPVFDPPVEDFPLAPGVMMF